LGFLKEVAKVGFVADNTVNGGVAQKKSMRNAWVIFA
jgi:hypothetical protein